MSDDRTPTEMTMEFAQAIARFLDVFCCKEKTLDLRCQLIDGHDGDHEATWTVTVPVTNSKYLPDEYHLDLA